MRVDASEVVSKVLKDLAKSTQANYKEPYISEGVVKDASPSFVVVRGHDGLTHFVATSAIVRMSERLAEKEY